MANKINDKVTYLISDTGVNAPQINLHSLPTKCPICHSFQEPQPKAFKYNHNDDAMVQFKCVVDKCNSSYTAFYLKGSYGKE